MKRKNIFFSLKNPKYGIPVVLLPFLLIGAWMIADLFPQKETKAAIEQEHIEGLNSDLPDPSLGEQKTKFELLQKLLEQRRTNAQMQGMEEKLDGLSEDDQNELMEMLTKAKSGDNSMESPLAGEIDMSGMNALEQLEKKYFPEEAKVDFSESPKSVQADELAQIKATLARMDSFMRNDKNRMVTEEVEILRATKANDQPTSFNTVMANKQEQFITAILDEAQTVVDGSRLRIRLLDDIFIGAILFKKGTYLYGLVSGFSAQRVNVNISSVLYGDKILKTNITLYDNDGIKGLYVPNSDFREMLRRGGQRLFGSNNVNIGGSSDVLQEMLSQMGTDFYQTVTQVVSSRIAQNKAKLKYASIIYLINEEKIEEQN